MSEFSYSDLLPLRAERTPERIRAFYRAISLRSGGRGRLRA